jgi:hypothetical protein
MFKTTEEKHKIKTIRRDDRMFYIKGNTTVTPRAAFEISTQCPHEYRLILSECIERGWIKPIAYMKESEYVWEQLGGTV